jgi:hypothetical protein
VFWRGVKVVGRESLRRDGKIIIDIADTDHKPSEIIAKHVGESAQNLIQKLRVGGAHAPPYGEKALKDETYKKRHLFVIHITCSPTMAANAVCVSSE